MTNADARDSAIAGLGRGIAWQYVAVACTSVGTILITAIVVRTLGADEFGIFAVIATVAGLMAMFDFGLSMSVVRASARDAAEHEDVAEARTDVATAHAAYVVLGVLGVIAVGAVVAAWPLITPSSTGSSDVRITIGAVGLAAAIAIATAALQGLAIGRRDLRLVAMATATGTAVNLLLVAATIESLGLVGVGLGQLLSVVTTRGILWFRIRGEVPWFHLRPKRPRRKDVRRVAAFAIPLLVISVGSQLVAVTDLLVVGAIGSATAVGFYKVGAMIPTLAIGILYRGYDTAFPYFAQSASSAARAQAVSFLTRVAGYLGGLGLGTLAFSRSDFITVYVGTAPPLTRSVLLIFCGVWLANLPVHGVALLLISEGKQTRFAPVVAVEVVANLGATIAFAIWLGPVGAALATLVTLTFSNLIVLPLVVRNRVGMPIGRLVAVDGLLPAAAGLVVAGVSGLLAAPIASPGLAVVAVITLMVAIGVPIGLMLLKGSGRQMLQVVLRQAPPGTTVPVGMSGSPDLEILG